MTFFLSRCRLLFVTLILGLPIHLSGMAHARAKGQLPTTEAPRLVDFLPKNTGCSFSLSGKSAADEEPGQTGPGRSSLPPQTSEAAAAEFLELLRLSHPLISEYVRRNSQKPFSPDHLLDSDLRVLALLYGDQRIFDFRETRNGGVRTGHAPFYDFLADLKKWHWLWAGWTQNAREEIADRFVSDMTASQWSFQEQSAKGESAPTTIYLDNFVVHSSFKTGRYYGLRFGFPRHWDVNDRDGLSFRLHRIIHDLRQRLADDDEMKAQVERELAADLPGVLKPAVRFLRAYHFFALSTPDRVSELVRKLNETRGQRLNLWKFRGRGEKF